MGGISMVVFFFVFKIIFPEGEANKKQYIGKGNDKGLLYQGAVAKRIAAAFHNFIDCYFTNENLCVKLVSGD